MSYSPKAIPEICKSCGFLECKCYNDEINLGDEFEYNPKSTEPETNFEEKELNFNDDSFDCFEFNDMADNWRQ